MKALVAMSGGVDSSVAAALAKEAGWEVLGVTMKMWQGPGGEAPTAGCCTVADAEDARRVAAQLDIPYYVWDYTAEFMSGVVTTFIDDYVSGRTPNPCVECNRTVKFSRLLAHADALDCDVVVTGHYARVDSAGGRYRLRRGVDPGKDQSYVLSMLGQDQLSRLSFPVGDLTKDETRAIASGLGIRTADKPDSQDICFVGPGDYREFLEAQGSEPVTRSHPRSGRDVARVPWRSHQLHHRPAARTRSGGRRAPLRHRDRSGHGRRHGRIPGGSGCGRSDRRKRELGVQAGDGFHGGPVPGPRQGGGGGSCRRRWDA